MQSDKKLKDYLIASFAEINKSSSFQGAVPGYFVQYGRLAEDRVELLSQKIRAIIKESHNL